MKQFMLLGLSLLTLLTQAQNISENEVALVYYMPKTELVFTIEYEQEIMQAGPLFLFAEQFLGTDEAIQEDDTIHNYIGINCSTRTLPDYERAYKIVPQDGVNTALISLTDKGILEGYNLAVPTKKPTRPQQKEKLKKSKHLSPMLIPLQEESANVTTLKEMAQTVMKQIYHIREIRMFLLSGETENPPADGHAMEQTLAELERQENQLLELFLGRRIYKRCSTTINYVPNQSEQVVLARFDLNKGVVAATEQGTPITLAINTSKQVYTAAVVDKKAPQPSQIYYNLPGKGVYTLTYGDETVATRQLQLPQLGIAVPLDKGLFSQKKQTPHILLNTKTGNILSITQ